MAVENRTVVIRGKASFCRILGGPVLNYNKDGKEWKFDLEIDPKTHKEMKSFGIGDKVKEKQDYLEGSPFMTFKQPEFRSSGQANKPIDVKDIFNRPWDHNKLIGNGSVLDVKFDIVDNGVGKKVSTYVRGVRVLDHIPYEREVFTELSEDDEYMRKAIAEAEVAATESA